jgi:hypothetical protein
MVWNKYSYGEFKRILPKMTDKSIFFRAGANQVFVNQYDFNVVMGIYLKTLLELSLLIWIFIPLLLTVPTLEEACVSIPNCKIVNDNLRF